MSDSNSPPPSKNANTDKTGPTKPPIHANGTEESYRDDMQIEVSAEETEQQRQVRQLMKQNAELQQSLAKLMGKCDEIMKENEDMKETIEKTRAYGPEKSAMLDKTQKKRYHPYKEPEKSPSVSIESVDPPQDQQPKRKPTLKNYPIVLGQHIAYEVEGIFTQDQIDEMGPLIEEIADSRISEEIQTGQARRSVMTCKMNMRAPHVLHNNGRVVPPATTESLQRLVKKVQRTVVATKKRSNISPMGMMEGLQTMCFRQVPNAYGDSTERVVKSHPTCPSELATLLAANTRTVIELTCPSPNQTDGVGSEKRGRRKFLSAKMTLDAETTGYIPRAIQQKVQMSVVSVESDGLETPWLMKVFGYDNQKLLKKFAGGEKGS